MTLRTIDEQSDYEDWAYQRHQRGESMDDLASKWADARLPNHKGTVARQQILCAAIEAPFKKRAA
jgi:hypothetical protein